MATLTIRDLSEEVVARLEARAKVHNRTLEAEARDILSKEADQSDRERFFREAQSIARKTQHRQKTDSVDLIREDRDRRALSSIVRSS